MFYKIWFIYCGGYDPPDEQTAWDACPTFCNKSDIIGDANWVDNRGLSCIFYQEEIHRLFLSYDRSDSICDWPNRHHMVLVSGSAYCGRYD